MARAQEASPPRHRPVREILAEAESAYAGLGGKVDTARAHELFTEAAATGAPVGIMRLAVHYALGKAGFPKDPRKATEMARPVLPAVERLAAGGDPVAMYLVGASYLSGIAREAEPAKAEPWFRKAAEQKHPWATHNLGWMYDSGTGVAQDPAAARSWYQRGAELGNASSMYNLGLELLQGSGWRDSEGGVGWLRKSAQRAYAPAAAALGKTLLWGKYGARPDAREAVEWLRSAADAGEDGARFDLGYAHWTGEGAARDVLRAAALWRPIAEDGDPVSRLMLGWLMVSGELPGDPAEGTSWIERGRAAGVDGFGPTFDWVLDYAPGRAAVAAGIRALEQRAAAGEPNAQALLAWLYSSGQGVDQDDARALDLARKAAARGIGGAMRVLGRAYADGNGVEQDGAQAVAWFRRGAEAGNSFCMMWLSQRLMRGEGTEIDRAAGLDWLRRAGEAGNYWAIADLGNLYDEGWYGLPTDADEAARWKRKGAALGDDRAKGWLLYRGLD